MRINSAARSSSSTTKANRSPEWRSAIDDEGTTGLARSSVSAVTTFSVGHNGSQTVKQAPWPSALSTVTVPLCSSTRFFTIVKPSPVPSNLRARLLSIWLNGVNSRSKSSLAIPMPLSVTLISMKSVILLSFQGKLRPAAHRPVSWPTWARGTRRARKVTSPPLGVNLTALDSRL